LKMSPSTAVRNAVIFAHKEDGRAFWLCQDLRRWI